MLVKDPLAFIVRSVGLTTAGVFTFLVTVTPDLSDNAHRIVTNVFILRKPPVSSKGRRVMACSQFRLCRLRNRRARSVKKSFMFNLDGLIVSFLGLVAHCGLLQKALRVWLSVKMTGSAVI